MTSALTTPTLVEPGRTEPWLGLESYSESDADVFYGRETESLELLRFVQRDTLTVVFGPSGTGKTSLLNAGLSPRLRANEYLPVYVRLDHSASRGSHASRTLATLASALTANSIDAEHLAEPLDSGSQETLWEYLHRTVFWDSRNRPLTPVLVFDQFEEIFTLGRNRPESDEFLVELADLVENYIPKQVRQRAESTGKTITFSRDEQPYRVVLSLREDYVPALDGLRRAMPSVMHNRYALTRMTGEQALRAVVVPGRDIVDAAVAEQIVRFVAAAREDVPGESSVQSLDALRVEPALLSVVCRELNLRRLHDGGPRITSALVAKASGDVLNSFYERAWDGIDPRARVFVESRLLTPGGFRSTAPLEEAIAAGLTREDIDALINRRLLRSEERLGIPHLELTHDLLTGVVKRSRAEREERERRAREEQERQKKEDERIRQERDLRRTRRLLIVVSIALAVAVVLGVVAVRMTARATAAQSQLVTQRDTLRVALDSLRQAQQAASAAQEAKVREMIAASWKSAVYFSQWDQDAFGNSWIYGARVFYNKLKPIMSLETMQSLSPEPVFLAGPHKSDFDLNSGDFGRYNPKFLAWASDRVIPAATDPKLRSLTQRMYNRYLRDLARGYYDTYRYLQADTARLARVIEGYTAVIAKDRARGTTSSGSPSRYLSDAFDSYASSYGRRGWFSRPAQPGTNLDFYTAKVAAGFWVRRTIDGTAPQFLDLLKKLLATYDVGWLREPT